jgi:hypothetical protein
MHVFPTDVKQPTFNIEINKGSQQQHFSHLGQQQEEVFLGGFYDPIVDYLEIMSSLNIKIFLSGEGQFCHLFKLHFCLLWFLIFLGSRSSMMSVNQFLTWLHWKHDFT